MVGRRFLKHDAGSGDAPSLASENTPISNVKFRVINANLKNAINNCRNILEAEIRTTNITMREKIQEWLAVDATNISFNVAYNKDVPLAHENESMRQLLSDLINGPLGSLLPKEDRRKLLKLVIPALPTANTPYYEDLREVDFFQSYESQTSLYQVSKTTLDYGIMTSSTANGKDEDLDSKANINYSSSNETVISAAQFKAHYMRKN